MQNNEAIWERVDARKDAYEALSDRVWETPEIAYTEHRSVAEHRATLLKEGFRITEELAGIATAITGEAGEGGPVIAILGEYDALPGLSQVAGIAEPREVVVDGHGHAACSSSRFRPKGRGGIPYGSLGFSECGIEIAENGMSDDEEESVRQEALAEEQFLLVELPAALRNIRAKAKGNEKLARKLVFGKLKYTGPEASFSSSHATVMKALDECFHVIVGKAADEIDKTRELLKELKREVMMR
jgi:hypothetical protein